MIDTVIFENLQDAKNFQKRADIRDSANALTKQVLEYWHGPETERTINRCDELVLLAAQTGRDATLHWYRNTISPILEK